MTRDGILIDNDLDKFVFISKPTATMSVKIWWQLVIVEGLQFTQPCTWTAHLTFVGLHLSLILMLSRFMKVERSKSPPCAICWRILEWCRCRKKLHIIAEVSLIAMHICFNLYQVLPYAYLGLLLDCCGSINKSDISTTAERTGQRSCMLFFGSVAFAVRILDRIWYASVSSLFAVRNLLERFGTGMGTRPGDMLIRGGLLNDSWEIKLQIVRHGKSAHYVRNCKHLGT